MSHEILWLVQLGVSQSLFSRTQARMVRDALGDGADLMNFAQKLIDDAIVEDIAKLETIARLALSKGQAGPPADDPFADEDDDGDADDSAPAAESVAADANLDFPFDGISGLNDDALAEAVRELLKATARSGASDLHFSTNARPFVRQDRSFKFISEHALTADEALLLNTALLDEGQKRTYLERKDYDYALALSGNDRYRVNLMFHKEGAAGAYRMIPEKMHSLADLGFEKHLPTLEKMPSFHNGLILVTGPVGSGKTTTLASMVDYLN
ncbi:MAG: Twitching mobility protein [Verrucomicrobiota bacterium]|jgi:twitching motility protein PilT